MVGSCKGFFWWVDVLPPGSQILLTIEQTFIAVLWIPLQDSQMLHTALDLEEETGRKKINEGGGGGWGRGRFPIEWNKRLKWPDATSQSRWLESRVRKVRLRRGNTKGPTAIWVEGTVAYMYVLCNIFHRLRKHAQIWSADLRRPQLSDAQWNTFRRRPRPGGGEAGPVTPTDRQAGRDQLLLSSRLRSYENELCPQNSCPQFFFLILFS